LLWRASVLVLLSALPALALSGTFVIQKDTIYLITSDVEDKKVLEIKKSVRDSNERLDDFDIRRDGDIITLDISLWADGGKADVKLVGDKADYYRLAMGVSLEETANKMAALLPGYKILSTSSDSDTISIEFGDKRGRERAPATASGGGTDGEAAESAAPSVDPDVQIKRDYADALKTNDPDKLIEFAQKYPDSSKAPMARKLALRLREDEAFQKVKKSQNLKELKGFIANFPDSRHVEGLQQRVDIIERNQQRSVEKEQAAAQEAKEKAAAEKKKRAELEEKRKRDEKAAAERKRKQAADAKQRAKDDKAFEASRHSEKGLQDYLQQYPKGYHALEAKQLLGKIIAERVAQEKANGGKQLLSARSVKTAPKVDGALDDGAWKGAEAVTVELQPEADGTHGVEAQVRAVISGGRVYFAVSWADKTQDTEYRPWTWDKEKGRYSQAPTLDDAFSIALYEGVQLEDSCMLRAKPHTTDIWLWRAFWSSISGKASDQLITTSLERIPKSNPYLAHNGGGPMWVRNLPDEGRLPWSYDIPVATSNPAASLPSYKRANGSGSANDVDAAGTWSKGRWSVEFSRARDTGNDDDSKIPANGRILISFAAYDKADRSNHSASDFVILETGGK